MGGTDGWVALTGGWHWRVGWTSVRGWVRGRGWVALKGLVTLRASLCGSGWHSGVGAIEGSGFRWKGGCQWATATGRVCVRACGLGRCASRWASLGGCCARWMSTNVPRKRPSCSVWWRILFGAWEERWIVGWFSSCVSEVPPQRGCEGPPKLTPLSAMTHH